VVLSCFVCTANSALLTHCLLLLHVLANLHGRAWLWFASAALHLACSNGHIHTAKLLIESGADLAARTVDDETPLVSVH
jgi:hypothetical protein